MDGAADVKKKVEILSKNLDEREKEYQVCVVCYILFFFIQCVVYYCQSHKETYVSQIKYLVVLRVYLLARAVGMMINALKINCEMQKLQLVMQKQS